MVSPRLIGIAFFAVAFVFIANFITSCSTGADWLGRSRTSPVAEAGTLLKAGKLNEAKAILDRYISGAPADVDRYLAVIEVTNDAGNMELTQSYGLKGIGAVSTAEVSKRGFLLRITAAACLIREDLKKAEELSEEAFRLLPNDPVVLNNYGYTLACMYDVDSGQGVEKLKTARAITEKAVRMARDQGYPEKQIAIFLDSLGWVQFKQRDYPTAVANLERALASAPEFKEMQLHLATAYFYTQRTSEAMSVVKRTLRSDPTNKDALNLEAILQRAMATSHPGKNDQ